MGIDKDKRYAVQFRGHPNATSILKGHAMRNLKEDKLYIQTDVYKRQPQSYEELLDFAGRWAERVEAGEVGDIRLNALRSCGYLMNDRRYTLWLTDLLLDIWIMRHQSAGRCV